MIRPSSPLTMLLLRHTRRREFIAVLGGAAAMPLAARAQQAKLPTIGVLGAGTPSAWTDWIAAFVRRLGELGWSEGRTVAIEYRWAEGRSERYREIAAEFVRLKVDVIVTVGRRSPCREPGHIGHSHRFRDCYRPARDRAGRVTGAARRQRHRPVDAGDGTGRQAARTIARGAARSSPSWRSSAMSTTLPRWWRWARYSPLRRMLGIDLDRLEIRRAEDIAPAIARIQGRYTGALRVRRRADKCPPRPHQHAGAGCATAHGLPGSHVSPSWRVHVLRSKRRRPIPARRRLCRQNSARGEAGRSAGRAADQVRTRHQPRAPPRRSASSVPPSLLARADEVIE